jgi:hypothetical protein
MNFEAIIKLIIDASLKQPLMVMYLVSMCLVAFALFIILQIVKQYKGKGK